MKVEDVVWTCPACPHEVIASLPLKPIIFEAVEAFVERHEYLKHGINPATHSYYHPDHWIIGDALEWQV